MIQKKINCQNYPQSMSEYDLQSMQIDQNIIVQLVPKGLNNSMSGSQYHDGIIGQNCKVIRNIQQLIKKTKNKQNQRIKYLKQRQKNLSLQMNKQLIQKQIRRKQLEQQQKQKLFQQCTFQPKINYSKKTKRNFNQFIQNQYAHTQKVKQKCNKLKKNIQQKTSQITYKPKINTNYIKKKQNTQSSVFDRLYALSQKQKNQYLQPVASFHPIINTRSKNLIRDGTIQQMLYGDALRRQQRDNQILNTISSSLIQKTQKPINYNKQKYAAQKFIKQYFYTLQQLKINTSLQTRIDYVTFNQLLKKLGFIISQQNQQNKNTNNTIQRTLIYDAYQLLDKIKVNARNICVFMLGIIGIYHINPINFQQGQQPNQDQQFNLDDVEGRKLQKQFDLFYRNRLSSQINRRNQDKLQFQSFAFQPSINKQSTQLAQKYRNAMLQQANQLIQTYPQLQHTIPQDGVISHTDLLVLNKMSQDIKKQKMKEEKVDQQLKQCTFKPNSISLKSSNIQINHCNAGSKKSFELYQYFKQAKSKKQSLQASRTEYDPQCTFKPTINKTKPPKLPQLGNLKQVEQTLYRMHKGRQEYQQKQKFFQRGQKLKQRKSSIKQSSQAPSLILDVSLGQKVDRIILFRGDENRLQEVAQQFATKHLLDEQSQGKLYQMLKIELDNVLAKIQEDQESQDNSH